MQRQRNTDTHKQEKEVTKMAKFYIRYVRYVLSALVTIAFGIAIS